MYGRVIIVGANQASLALAEFLGKGGLDICIYEKQRREEVGYDWHDDMHPCVFEDVGIPMPEERFYFPKGDWSFVSPDERSVTRIYQDARRVDLSIERRRLNDYLYQRAKKYASFYYNTLVTRVLTDGERVSGVVLSDSSSISADLVVDASGALSACRSSLPASFGIQRTPDRGDLFRAWRAFVSRAPGSPDPQHTNKVYLKHLGERGISWCIWDKPSDSVNVLVGRIDELTRTDFERAYSALRADNPIIGDEILRGGQRCTIPVRRPISRMFAPGYALLGDSAFMTVPILGSGMASSIRAGHMLAQTVLDGGDDPFGASNLYRYQRRFMQEMGAEFSGIELLKNWLLNAPAQDVSFLFNSGVLSQEDLKRSCVGELIKLTPAGAVQKAVRGGSELKLLARLTALLARMDRQIKIARNMPPDYDEPELARWQRRYSAAFGSEI